MAETDTGRDPTESSGPQRTAPAADAPAARAGAATTDSVGGWRAVLRELGPVFADRAAVHDRAETFVAENFEELKWHGFFTAAVPRELGGRGAGHGEMCDALRELAHYCGSTALAASMHQHLLATAVWRYLHGQPGEALLRAVAERELVLVTTGGRDWLASNGEMRRVEGGYRVTARKSFASGCEAGDLLLSSARYEDPERGTQVLHFALPLATEGVRLLDDWHTLGMRATGSRTVLLEDAFVPDPAVTVTRLAGAWHPSFAVVAGVALPLVMSVYLGIAERAAEIAREQARRKPPDDTLPYLLGEMENSLTMARIAWRDAVARNDDHAFEPTLENANAFLISKTLITNAVVATVEKALEAVGGVGFFEGFGLERLVRDVHAAQFHPLPEKQQVRFSGRVALGLDPIGA